MPVFASSFSAIGGGVISLGVGSSPPAGNFILDNTTPVTNAAGTSAIDFSYHAMPSAPRTMLNFVTSWGIGPNSNNTGSSTWNAGYGGQYGLTHHTNTNSYFAYSGNNGVRYGRGDGGPDNEDWAIVDFYHATNGDYSGNANNSSGRYMGGERPSYSGGAGGISVYISSSARLRMWGFNTSVGWKLLFEHGMSSTGGTGFNHNFTGWWNAGSSTGAAAGTSGKRADYDTLSITYIGYSASQN